MFNNLLANQGGYPNPTVAAKFAQSANDFTPLNTLSSMPTGGSISRAGNAMVYDSTGKLTYAPNNLVTYSNTFTNAAWSKNASGVGVTPVVTLSSGAGPSGEDAFRCQFSVSGTTGLNTDASDLRQVLTTTSSVQIGSLWVKSNTGSNQTIYIRARNTLLNITVTTSWQRFNVVGTAGGDVLVFGLRGDQTGTVNTTADVLVCNAQLEAVTYQTTPSTYVATTSAAYYGPRFDYDPSTLAAKGLLIEGTRTNLLTYSEQFDNASWLQGSISVTANQNTSPDGTQTSDLVAATATGTGTFLRRTVTVSASTAYTVGFYVKSGTSNIFNISAGDGTDYTRYWYNTNTGVVGSTAIVGAGLAAVSANIVSVGNGWYRCNMTFTMRSITTLNIFISPCDADGSLTVTSGKTMNFWGAQLEAGSFATSYIPTVASTVARAAETFAITGYSSNLINATYIDEQTGVTSMQPYNAGVAPSPSFSWLTGLRVYTNAYAGNIATPSWLSFSRTGNAMVTDSTGKLTWAPANEAIYSQDFSQSWVKSGLLAFGSGSTQNTSATTDPFSLNNAALITEDTAAGRHFVYRGHITVVGVQYIASVYAKAATRTVVALGIRNNTGTVGYCVVVNLSTGAISTTSSVGTPTGICSGVSSVGNGWYRISVGMILDATNAFFEIGVSNSATPSYFANMPTYTGDGASGLYIYGAQLERVTYDTAPSAYIPTTTAAVYGPRYDFDASTVPATPRGLLIEESRSNICLRSQEFDNGSWVKTSVTVSANSVIAPDGTQTADTLTPNSGAGTTWSNLQNLTITNATAYTFSCYVKSNGAPFAAFAATAMGGVIYAGVNLATGATTSSGTVTVTAINVGNGWYRLVATATSSGTATAFYVYPSSNGQTSLTADGVSGLHVWGAQLEAGSFATSYIPTTSASVTRAADVPTLSGAALTAAGAATGSAIVQTSLQLYQPKATGLLGDYVNRRLMYFGTNTELRTYNGSVANTATISGGWTLGQVRAAVGWDAIGFSTVGNNGTLVTQGTVGSPQPMGTAASVSLGYASGYALNGWIASAAFYNQRLPDAILKRKSAVNSPY